MNVNDDSYSRFVALAKVILPIVALGVLSTLFLFSHNVDPDQSIPYAEVDVEGLAREQGIGAPKYAGVTQDGSAISISAKSARPDPDSPKRIIATGLIAIIEDAAGGRLEITSKDGVIDSKQQFATLHGEVRIQTSTGYTIDTAGIATALNKTEVITDGRITAKGPLGLIDAGLMELKQQDGSNGSNLLVFKDGIKLVYTPQGQ